MRLQPTENQTFSGLAYIIDCNSFIQVTLSTERLQLWQTGGATCEYQFNQTSEEFSKRFINKWVHYSFSYSNYSLALNQMMSMRIFINGEQVSQCRVRNAPTVQSNSGRGTCIIGNSYLVADQLKPGTASTALSSSQTALSADLAYFVILSLPRQSAFSLSSLYPSSPPFFQSSSSFLTLFYLRLDSQQYGYQDFYLNRGGASGVTPYRVEHVKTPFEIKQLCECYGEPVNVATKMSNASGLIQQEVSIDEGYAIEFWVKLWESKTGTVGDVIELRVDPGVIKVRMAMNAFEVQIGTGSSNFDMLSSGALQGQRQQGVQVLQYREWTQIGIVVGYRGAKKVSMFRNGVKVSVQTHNSPALASLFKNLTLLVKPNSQTALVSLYRLRFMLSPDVPPTPMTFDDLFLSSYRLGSNNISLSVGQLFDFIFTDYNLQNSSSTLSQGVFRSQNASLSVAQVEFMFDNTMCGGSGTTQQQDDDMMCCNDGGWTTTFMKSKNVMHARLQALAPELTIEFWLKPLSLQNISTILEIGDRLRIDLLDWQIRSKAVVSVNDSLVLAASTQVQTGQWIQVMWQTSVRRKSTRAGVFKMRSENAGEMANETRAAFPDMVFPGYANVYLGNGQFGDRPYVGMMKELRIWKEYRTQDQMFIYRNIEIPQTVRYSMLHYFRMVGDTDILRITDNLQLLQTSDFDFSLLNIKPTDSPLRFTIDTPADQSLLLCLYGLYPNYLKHLCISPVQDEEEIPLNAPFTTYPSNQNTLQIIDSRLNLTEILPAYNIMYSLISVKPANKEIVQSKQIIFNQTNVSKFQIERYKLITPARQQYEVELKLSNKYYERSQFGDQAIIQQRVWINPGCPSINVLKIDPVNGTVTIYALNGTAKGLVQVYADTSCMDGQSWFTKSKYEWQWEGIEGFRMNQSQNSLTIESLKPIQEGIQIKVNVSLVYNNTLIGDKLQKVTTFFTLKFSKDPIAFIFTTSTGFGTQESGFIFWTQYSTSLNASLSNVIYPGLQGRRLKFQLDCPRSLFRTQADYTKYCYMTYQGLLEIPASVSLNFLPAQLYPFTVTASVLLAEHLTASTTVYFSWNTLSSSPSCPQIVIEQGYYNVSLHVNSSSAINVLPKYSLYCQRQGYVASYLVKSINWTFGGYINQEIVQFKDKGLWVTVKKNEKMKVGDRIAVNVAYKVESDEGMQELEAQTELRIIDSEIKVQVNGLKTGGYRTNENMIFDLKGTYDPEDPGLKLHYAWICPNETFRQYWPVDTLDTITFTPEARLGFLWKYDVLNALQVQISNPKLKKYLLITLSFTLQSPPLTSGVSLCPYYSFPSLVKNRTDDSYDVQYTNSFIDVNLPFPQYRLNCNSGSTTKSTTSLIAMNIFDPYNLTQASNKLISLRMPSTLQVQGEGFKIIGQRMQSMEEEKIFQIRVIMWYKSSQVGAELQYYQKEIRVRRKKMEQELIAEMAQTYITVMSGSDDIVVVDASRSRDNGNLKNRDFNYRWECSKLMPDILCPQNASKLNFSAQIRRQFNLDFPGRLFDFKVQIYDSYRTSPWAQSSVFISPTASLTCLTILNLGPPLQLPMRITSLALFPLSHYISIAQYCPDLTIDSITLTSTSSELSFIRNFPLPNTNITLVQLSIDDNDDKFSNDQEASEIMATVTYRISYNILNALVTSAQYQYQVMIQDNRGQQQKLIININGPTIVNMQLERAIVVNVNWWDGGSYASNGEVVEWRCDSRLQIDTLCKTVRGSELKIGIADIELANMTKLNKDRASLQFQAIVQGQMSSIHFVQLSMLDQVSYSPYQNCKIHHSQEILQEIDIRRPLYFVLFCPNLSSDNFSLSWTAKDLIIKLQQTSTFLLSPLILEHNTLYSIQVTLSTTNALEPLQYTYLLNTTTSRSHYQSQPDFTIVSTTDFLPTYYNSTFTLTLANNPDLSQNMFYSLYIENEEGMWFTYIPLQVWDIASNQHILRVPKHEKMLIEICNNEGYAFRKEIKLEMFENKDQNTQQIKERMKNLDESQRVEIIQEMYMVAQIGIDDEWEWMTQKLIQINKQIWKEIRQREGMCIVTNQTCIQQLQSTAYIYCQIIDHVSIQGLKLSKTQTSFLSSLFLTFFPADLEDLVLDLLISDLNPQANLANFFNSTVSFLKNSTSNSLSLPVSFHPALYNHNLSTLQPFQIYTTNTVTKTSQALLLTPSNLQTFSFNNKTSITLLSPSMGTSETTTVEAVFHTLNETNAYWALFPQKGYVKVLMRDINGQKKRKGGDQCGFVMRVSGLIGEEYENGTCAYRNVTGGTWKFLNDSGVDTTKREPGIIECKVHGGVDGEYAVLMIDQKTLMPKLNEIEFINKDEEVLTIKVSFLIASISICLGFLFFQILALYADLQNQKQNSYKDLVLKQYELLQQSKLSSILLTEENETSPGNASQPSKLYLFALTLKFQHNLLSLVYLNISTIPLLIRIQLALTTPLLYAIISTIIFLSSATITWGTLQTFLFALITSSVLFLPLNLLRNYLYQGYGTLLPPQEGSVANLKNNDQRQEDSATLQPTSSRRKIFEDQAPTTARGNAHEIMYPSQSSPMAFKGTRQFMRTKQSREDDKGHDSIRKKIWESIKKGKRMQQFDLIGENKIPSNETPDRSGDIQQQIEKYSESKDDSQEVQVSPEALPSNKINNVENIQEGHDRSFTFKLNNPFQESFDEDFSPNQHNVIDDSPYKTNTQNLPDSLVNQNRQDMLPQLRLDQILESSIDQRENNENQLLSPINHRSIQLINYRSTSTQAQTAVRRRLYIVGEEYLDDYSTTNQQNQNAQMVTSFGGTSQVPILHQQRGRIFSRDYQTAIETDQLPQNQLEEVKEDVDVGPPNYPEGFQIADVAYQSEDDSQVNHKHNFNEASIEEISQLINSPDKNVRPRYMYALIHGFVINGVILAANILFWRQRLEDENYSNESVNHFISNYLQALGFSILLSTLIDIISSALIVSKLIIEQYSKIQVSTIGSIILFGGSYSQTIFIEEVINSKLAKLQTKQQTPAQERGKQDKSSVVDTSKIEH